MLSLPSAQRGRVPCARDISTLSTCYVTIDASIGRYGQLEQHLAAVDPGASRRVLCTRYHEAPLTVQFRSQVGERMARVLKRLGVPGGFILYTQGRAVSPAYRCIFGPSLWSNTDDTPSSDSRYHSSVPGNALKLD
jgi:hypothetical protein